MGHRSGKTAPGYVLPAARSSRWPMELQITPAATRIGDDCRQHGASPQQRRERDPGCRCAGACWWMVCRCRCSMPTSFRPIATSRSALVQRPYPVKDLDFTSSGAYSVYNWELFFHVPITIAIHLSKNQRFAEAQRWFHYLFDPTDDSDGPTPERFWKVRPFQYTDVKKIEEILVNLATGADEDAAQRDHPQHRGLEGCAVPPARHRPLPAAGLHVQDRDGLPGQPDRLGRFAVPAGHRRGHRRGDDAVRAGGQHPRPAPAAGAEEGHGAPADLRQPAAGPRPVRHRHARRGGGPALRPDAVPRRRARATTTGWRRCAAWARRSTSACRATTSC